MRVPEKSVRPVLIPDGSACESECNECNVKWVIRVVAVGDQGDSWVLPKAADLVWYLTNAASEILEHRELQRGLGNPKDE